MTALYRYVWAVNQVIVAYEDELPNQPEAKATAWSREEQADVELYDLFADEVLVWANNGEIIIRLKEN